MKNNHNPITSVQLAYFSGTGGTKAIVQCFEEQFALQGIATHTSNIGINPSAKVIQSDLLLIFSPVYAFRLSPVIETWVKNIPTKTSMRAGIISVSGGGEISPNTACRSYCKKILLKKGFDVTYEAMLVMPSNFFIQASPEINQALLKIMPNKVSTCVNDLLQNTRRLLSPNFIDNLLPPLGRMEHLGAKAFGANIHASSSCNQCGLCVAQCPRKNIRFKNKIPTFGVRCIWCMKCIYACPKNALSPRFLKFTVLKGGFSIKKMKEAAKQDPSQVTFIKNKNIAWQGAIDYINESL